MIFKEQILESRCNSLKYTELEIMQEYYENEISFLNSVIEYKDQVTLTESTHELQSLEEGFVGSIISKIKEMVSKFIQWLKDIWNSFTSLFKSKIESEEKKVEKVKDAINKIDKDKNLSQEQKEAKKQQIVNSTIIKKEDSDNKNSNNITKRSFKDIRYEYLDITGKIKVIEDVLFFNTRVIMSTIDIDELEELSVDDMVKVTDLLFEKCKEKTVEETWEYFNKRFYKKNVSFSSINKMITTYEDNLKGYSKIQQMLDIYKKRSLGMADSLNEVVEDLTITVKNMDTAIRGEKHDDSYYKQIHTIFNKIVNIIQKEVNAATQVVPKIGANLKVKIVK